MKKFKKSLAINVPQDNHRQVSSPNHVIFKQNKERPLLMYNQHTIASSANNQDEPIEYNDHQLATCQDFVEFHEKITHQTKNTNKNQAQQHGYKTQKYKKFNVIQFEEFSIQGDKDKSYNQSTTKIFNTNTTGVERQQFRNNKRQFSIEIPENQQKQQKQQNSTKFSFEIKSQGTKKHQKQGSIKQPPAPSNKSKMAKTLNRHFVFPTNDEEDYFQTGVKRQKNVQKVPGKFIPQDQHENKIKELNREWSQKLQAVNKSFEKERQQFYKEKSSLEKDLMIKDGQIQMLQKLITNRYSPKESSNANSHYTNHQLPAAEKQEHYKSSLIGEKQKGNLYLSEEKITSMETILLEKDLQINSLLQKINELNSLIDKKSNQLDDVTINLLKSQKMNESLRNQIFIYENKEQSEKLTKNFYKMKQALVKVNQSSKTPKSFSRPKWQEDIQLQKQKPKSPQKNQYPLRGIDDLHKRLQSLKMNRIQLENRGRIKSELAYPQTSKNKTKGTFDFKGKFYDRDRDFIHHSRMY